jgi:glycerol-3-phosphate dehydrogenase (NAD(P)+)
MDIKNITILGGGTWGTTLGLHLFKKRYDVKIWEFFPDVAEVLIKERRHPKLKEVVIPKELTITSDLRHALDGADLVVIAVSSQNVREVMKKVKNIGSSAKFISVSKGIENNSLMRISEIISQEIEKADLSVLSGPSHAEEVVRELPTTIVAASENMSLAKKVQEIFSCPYFRVYINPDVIGVELGGALKNTIAIAAGISDGLGYGANTKAALLTRGLAEITRLGVAVGAKRETFFGLAGLGDLLTTAMSGYSRNRNFGELLAKGYDIETAQEKIGQVVEGVKTAVSALALAEKYKVETPIIFKVNEVLFKGKSSKEAVNELMERDLKSEAG